MRLWWEQLLAKTLDSWCQNRAMTYVFRKITSSRQHAPFVACQIDVVDKELVSPLSWNNPRQIDNVCKKMYAGHCLENIHWMFPMKLGLMAHCMGLGGVIPPVGSRGNTPKAPTILWVCKALQYIAKPGLIYTRWVNRSKQITTSKDKIKDCHLDDEEINFAFLQKWCYMLCQ